MIGSIGPFEEGTESWTHYQERLEQFFEANDIRDAKKRAVLLSICGKATYQLASSLLAPAELAQSSYVDICKALKTHFDPQPPELVLRSRFYERSRRAGESVAEFLAELRKLAKDCNFGSSLEGMLRDRLSLGINDEAIENKLRAEETLTLNKAFSIAQAHEAAARSCLSGSQKETTQSSVHALRRQGPGGVKRCFRCLSSKHLSANCPFLEKRCFNCSKIGHTAAACRSSTSSRKEQQKVQEVEAAELEDQLEEEAYSLHQMAGGRKRVPPIMTMVVVNGTPLRMEIDTGASVSLISDKTFKECLGSKPELQPDSTLLRTYSGELMRVKGCIQVLVEVNGVSKKLQLLVVNGGGSSLLGRDWLSCLPLNWRDIKKVSQTTKVEHPRIRKLLEDYSEVFDSGLGEFSGPPVHLQLKTNARPRFMRARSVPFALKAKVEAQLDKEIQQGVLTPVTHSDYASPVVPVLKADGSVRICADFKRTVNLDVEPDTYPLPKIEEIFANRRAALLQAGPLSGLLAASTGRGVATALHHQHHEGAAALHEAAIRRRSGGGNLPAQNGLPAARHRPRCLLHR
jgi:hypothetical protein